MGCDAQPDLRVVHVPAVQIFEYAQEAVSAIDEAALLGRVWFRTKPTVGVEHRQHGHGDARATGGPDHLVGHLGQAVIGFAVGLMVQIVELAHGRVTGFQHLDIELCCYRADLLGIQARQELVHDVAPGPEAVLAAGPGALGQPGHGPLESVTVQVRHARQHRAGQTHGSTRGFHIRLDRRDGSGVIDTDQYIVGPALGQQRCPGEIVSHTVPIPDRSSVSRSRYL